MSEAVLYTVVTMLLLTLRSNFSLATYLPRDSIRCLSPSIMRHLFHSFLPGSNCAIP